MTHDALCMTVFAHVRVRVKSINPLLTKAILRIKPFLLGPIILKLRHY